MDPGEPSYFTLTKDREDIMPVQTSHSQEEGQNHMGPALQGISHDDARLDHSMSYPSFMTIAGPEPTSTGLATPFPMQGFEPGTFTAPVASANATVPLIGPRYNVMTPDDIQQMRQHNSQQYYPPAPQTVNQHPLRDKPTYGPEYLTRSFSDSGYRSKASTAIPSTNASFWENPPVTTSAALLQQQQYHNYYQSFQQYRQGTPSLSYAANTPSVQDFCTDTSPRSTKISLSPKIRKKKEPRSIRCGHEGCDWLGRCQSEKRKHISQKHTKPYTCELGKCKATVPRFGSLSDLKRHQTTCHPDENTPKFKCFLCQTEKIFKRKDNFTAHLHNCHGLGPEEREKQIELSNRWSKTPIDLLPVDGSQYSASLIDAPGEPFSQPPDGFPTTDLNALDFLALDAPRQTGDEVEDGIKPLAETCPEEREVPSMASMVGLTLPSLPDPRHLNSTSHVNPIQYPDAEGLVLPTSGLPENEINEELLQSIRNVDLKFDQPVIQEPAQSTVEVEGHKCPKPGCNTSCRVPSLLRKHMKRHERPYGCTFNNCYKRFGSKGDWIRHETTRHSHREFWRCSDPSLSDSLKECAQTFEQKDLYKDHLQKHEIYTEDEIERRFNNNRLGGDCHYRFWCGFCKCLIPTDSEGYQCLKQRFDHIYTEHFEKKQDISDWVPADCHITKGQSRRAASEVTSTTTGRNSTNSVLGSEDGTQIGTFPEAPRRPDTSSSPRSNKRLEIRHRSISRSRRSRTSRSPPLRLKRRREKSRSTSESPSAPARKISARHPSPLSQLEQQQQRPPPPSTELDVPVVPAQETLAQPAPPPQLSPPLHLDPPTEILSVDDYLRNYLICMEEQYMPTFLEHDDTD